MSELTWATWCQILLLGQNGERLVAYRAAGSLSTTSYRHSCSYLGWILGPCLGGGRSCVYVCLDGIPKPGIAVCRMVVAVALRASGC